MTNINANDSAPSWKPVKRQSLFMKLHLDWPLLAGILALSVICLVLLFSAKKDPSLLQKQTLRILFAIGIMLCVAQIPPRVLKQFAKMFYISSLIALVLVLVMGHVSKGAQRWLDLGFFKFQPAELMKIAVPLMVAKYFDSKALPPKFRDLLIPFCIILVPVLLIGLQPDLGTAILVASIGFFIIFFAGISWKFILGIIISGLAFLPILWLIMHDYQKRRILTLLNPESDPLGNGYHIIQSKIAIGSGGFFGKGWLKGTQSNLDFLPERSTDFIFAVSAEEFGLIGVMVLLLVYFVVIARGLYIGIHAQESFTRLLAGSIAMSFFVYIFVNIGMVSGILPIVGIPLPLISYGGTSLVTLMISFGILMSIKTHRNLLKK